MNVDELVIDYLEDFVKVLCIAVTAYFLFSMNFSINF